MTEKGMVIPSNIMSSIGVKLLINGNLIGEQYDDEITRQAAITRRENPSHSCFWPPKIWFAHSFLDMLHEQLYSIRNRHNLDPRCPGWIHGNKIIPISNIHISGVKVSDTAQVTVTDYDKIIFCEDYSDYGGLKQQWIWTLIATHERKRNHILGVWLD